MNKVYMHSKDTINNIYKRYILAIIPVMIYGIYKNGVLLYDKKLIIAFAILRPLFFVLIPFCINLILEYIKTRRIKLDFYLVSWLYFGLFMPPQMSLAIYTTCVLFLSIFGLFVREKINWVAICIPLVSVVLLIINQYTFFNFLEMRTEYSFTFWDLFWGRGIGGICSTSSIYALIVFLILCFNKYYKYEIPITSITLYTFMMIIYAIISNSFNEAFINYAGISLAIILFGTIPIFTPYSPKGRILYGIILGIFCFGFHFICPFECAFLSIFILSFLSKPIDDFLNRHRAE